MLAAGLLARNARKRGLMVKPWVKTSLAPGSRVVTEYYERTVWMRTSQLLDSTTLGMGAPPALGTQARWIQILRQPLMRLI